MKLFTKHPHSLGETYFQHAYFALHFGFNLVIGGLACIIHAIFPFLFQNTGSQILLKMAHHFVERMPTLSERVLALAKTIDAKRENELS